MVRTIVGTVNCAVCHEPENEEMVQCDVCDEWTHFICAGVSEDIADKAWSCKKCVAAATSNVSKTLTTPNQQLTEHEKQGHEKVGENDDRASKQGSAKSKRSMKYEKYEIMRRYESSEESDDDTDLNALKVHRTAEWASGKGQGEIGRAKEGQLGTGAMHDRVVTGRGRNEAQMQARTTSEVNAGGLNAQQISSRHVVSKDLPAFSGKAEEWPLFLSSFQNSTRLCRFTHDENLLRLQRALKGKALEYVGSKLMIPELVPEIISTLRMVFGKPEQIINSLLGKLRSSAPVNVNKLDTLITFALEVKNVAATMEASGLQSHMTNPVLIQELVEKLPAQMRLQWAMFSRPSSDANLKAFSDWLFDLADAASNVTSVLSASNPESEKRKAHRVSVHAEEKNASREFAERVKPKLLCYLCKESHVILKCDKFKNLGYDEKWNEVRRLQLCRLYLRKHDARSCRERKACGVNGCTYKHHPLLHKTFDAQTAIVAHHKEVSNTLYRVVPITIYGRCDVIPFLDDGSGPTLIEKSVLQRLQVQGAKADLCLKWTDGTVRVQRDSDRIDLDVSPRGKQKRLTLRNVRSVDVLDLPLQTMDITELAGLHKHLRGIPVESYRNVVPQLIIGLSNKNVMMPLKFREGKAHEPAATKTRLGWTVYGVINTDEQQNVDNMQLHVCECDDDVALQKLVTEYMSLEKNCNDRENNQFQSTELNEMRGNVKRKGEHFVAKLLWKSESTTMPDNYPVALRRLTCFERKLESSPDLRLLVNEHIRSMEEKGYIRKLSTSEISAYHPRKWYLPIFAVRNPNKPQKVRIVWDAAAEYKGLSLNSCLDKGPDLLTSLFDVLLNFRIGKIGLCGDICEMFHRVHIDEEDQQSQRFLWRNCEDARPPDVYMLLVMSFGASCSPSLAQVVKNLNALEFADTHPKAAKSILERHYVDDRLDSVDTIDEAVQLATSVRAIHKHANFHIRGWLDQVVEASKVLGMWWQTSDDTLTYNLKFTKANDEILRGAKLPTKRELLRLLMSIFDPLGLLTFFLIDAKILLQKVWRSGIGWDDSIP